MRTVITNWLGSIFSTQKPSRSSRPRTDKRSRIGLEPLESRNLMAAGALDTSFGTSGKTLAAFDRGGTLFDNVAAVAVDSRGRTVVAGTVERANGNYDFGVARFLPNGALDRAFSDDGLAEIFWDIGGTANYDFVNDLAIDGSDRVVVVGSVRVGDDYDFGIARLTTSGRLDTSFSGDGKLTVAFDRGNGDFDGGEAVSIDRAGRIVVGGSISRVRSGDFDYGVVRVNPNGTVDTSFGSSGQAIVAFDAGGDNTDLLSDIAIDSSNRVVLVGTVDRNNSGDTDIGVARLTSSGRLDTTFNGTGKRIVTFDRGGSNTDDARGVAIDSRGRIVVGATVQMNSSGDTDFGAFRLTSNGALDSSFGSGGKTTVAFDMGGRLGDNLAGIAVDRFDRVVLASSTFSVWVQNLWCGRMGFVSAFGLMIQWLESNRGLTTTAIHVSASGL
jgi:uncharacterized delta-60 repeat protein